MTGVDSQSPSRSLTMRVDDDHFDREIGLVLHIQGRSESDDLDIVLQLDIACYLMRNLVKSRAKVKNVFASSVDGDPPDGIPSGALELDT